MTDKSPDNTFGGEWDDGEVGSSGVIITGGQVGPDGKLVGVKAKVLSTVKLPGHIKKPVITPELEGLAEQARRNVREKVASGEIVLGVSNGFSAVSMTSAINDEFNALLAARTAASPVPQRPLVPGPPEVPVPDRKKALPNVKKAENPPEDRWSGVVRRELDIDVPESTPPQSQQIKVQLDGEESTIRFVANQLVGLGSNPSNFEGVVFVVDLQYGTMDESVVDSILNLQGVVEVRLFDQDGELFEMGGEIPSWFSILTPVQLFSYGGNTFVIALFD